MDAELVIPSASAGEFGPFLIIISKQLETFQEDTVNGEYAATLLRSSKIEGSYYNFTIKGKGVDYSYKNKAVPDKQTEALIKLANV